MSEVIITAAAWTFGEPQAVETKTGEGPIPAVFRWTIHTEACVTDNAGAPESKLPKGAWKVHATDASGNSEALGFSVAEVAVAPGFYLLKLDQFFTDPWVAPTACGIAIQPSKKREVEGQVVVPIALAGPTVVSNLTTPEYPLQQP